MFEGNGATGMPALAPADARLKGMLNNNGSTTTIAGNTAQYSTLGYYPYQYPYYADYNLANRVASLEGEVRVLREMVAALLSSGKAASSPRGRK